jgi:hypothetical protein
MHWQPKRADIFPVLPMLAWARAIDFAWTTDFIQIPHHAFNPMGHTVLLALSIPHGFGGPIRTGPALR